jgi:hypothetical protein
MKRYLDWEVTRREESGTRHALDELPLADDGGLSLQALGQFALVTEVEVEGLREVLAGVGGSVGSEMPAGAAYCPAGVRYGIDK